MPVLAWILRALALLVVTATLLPLLRKDAWWIRACEFPRVQLLVGAGVVLGLSPVIEQRPGLLWLEILTVGGAAVLQSTRILPFTGLWPLRMSRRGSQTGPSLSLFVANVLMTNRQKDRFLSRVQELDASVS